MSSKRILAIMLCVVLCCNNLVYALDNETSNSSEVQVENKETIISPEAEKEDESQPCRIPFLSFHFLRLPSASSAFDGSILPWEVSNTTARARDLGLFFRN